VKPNPNETPHIYFDDAIGKWISKEPSSLPDVLVVSWGAEPSEIFEQFLSKAESLPANIILIDKDHIHQLIENLESERVVACIGFISQEALEDKTFSNMVSTCNKLFLKKQEFRLFVQLVDGLTLDILKIEAKLNTKSAAGQLIESVNLPSKGKSDILKSLNIHLLNLPKIRHRLARERLENSWIKILSFFSVFIRLLFTTTPGMLLILGLIFKNQIWIPWMFFGAGQLSFISLLTLLTLGTHITSGVIFRWMLVPASLLLVYLLYLFSPFWTLYWTYFLAGGLTAALMDSIFRSIVQWERRNVEIDNLLKDDKHEPPSPSRRSFGFLWKGPWFPKPSRIFVSYSTRSIWGSSVAKYLHSYFKDLEIDCFFAPESIEPGSSWRHRLKSEFWTTNIFVQLLDNETAVQGKILKSSEHWPAIELAIASAHQSVSALPSIVIVCHPSMDPNDITEEVHPYIRKVLSGENDSEISSLRVIKLEEEPEENFAKELTNELAKSYRWDAVSILPIKIAAIFDLILMAPGTFLAMVGILGSIAIWVVMIAALVMYFQDESLANWLQLHGYEFGALLLAAYTLGFVIRLLAASRFEVWHQDSKSSTKWRLIETAILVGYCLRLTGAIHTIGLIYTIIALSFGVMLGSFYLQMSVKAKSKPKGWVKS